MPNLKKLLLFLVLVTLVVPVFVSASQVDGGSQNVHIFAIRIQMIGLATLAISLVVGFIYRSKKSIFVSGGLILAIVILLVGQFFDYWSRHIFSASVDIVLVAGQFFLGGGLLIFIVGRIMGRLFKDNKLKIFYTVLAVVVFIISTVLLLGSEYVADIFEELF